MAVFAKFDGITSNNRANVMHSRSSFTAAKKLLSAYASQGNPRSIADFFTRSNGIEEVSFGLFRSNPGAYARSRSDTKVSFGLARNSDHAPIAVKARIDVRA